MQKILPLEVLYITTNFTFIIIILNHTAGIVCEALVLILQMESSLQLTLIARLQEGTIYGLVKCS